MTSATDSQAKDAPADETPVPAGKIGAGATAEDARAVAEAARESGWDRPSFAKGIYLGNFDLSLAHPWPTPDPADVAGGDGGFFSRGVFGLAVSCGGHGLSPWPDWPV